MCKWLSVAAIFFVGVRVDAVPPGKADDQFLKDIFVQGHAEIAYSELAERRAANDKVKEFAREMVKEHKRCNEKLAQLLKDRKLAIVAGTEKQTKEEVARLSKLEGANFDRAYMDRMIQDHEKAVAMVQTQTTAAVEADVRAFAKEALPTLKTHLERAKEIAKALK